MVIMNKISFRSFFLESYSPNKNCPKKETILHTWKEYRKYCKILVSKGEVIEGFVTLQNYFNCYIFKYCSKLLGCHLQNKNFSHFLLNSSFLKSSVNPLGPFWFKNGLDFGFFDEKSKKSKKKHLFFIFSKNENRGVVKKYLEYTQKLFRPFPTISSIYIYMGVLVTLKWPIFKNNSKSLYKKNGPKRVFFLVHKTPM